MRAVANGTSNRVLRRIRVRAILFLVLALVVGIGAVLLVKTYPDRMSTARANMPVSIVKVVVSATPIPIGTPLSTQHVKLISWPSGDAPTGAFSNVKQVLGRTVRQTLVAGEPILSERLAD